MRYRDIITSFGSMKQRRIGILTSSLIISKVTLNTGRAVVIFYKKLPIKLKQGANPASYAVP